MLLLPLNWHRKRNRFTITTQITAIFKIASLNFSHCSMILRRNRGPVSATAANFYLFKTNHRVRVLKIWCQRIRGKYTTYISAPDRLYPPLISHVRCTPSAEKRYPSIKEGRWRLDIVFVRLSNDSCFCQNFLHRRQIKILRLRPSDLSERYFVTKY